MPQGDDPYGPDRQQAPRRACHSGCEEVRRLRPAGTLPWRQVRLLAEVGS